MNENISPHIEKDDSISSVKKGSPVHDLSRKLQVLNLGDGNKAKNKKNNFLTGISVSPLKSIENFSSESKNPQVKIASDCDSFSNSESEGATGETSQTASDVLNIDSELNFSIDPFSKATTKPSSLRRSLTNLESFLCGSTYHATEYISSTASKSEGVFSMNMDSTNVVTNNAPQLCSNFWENPFEDYFATSSTSVIQENFQRAELLSINTTTESKANTTTHIEEISGKLMLTITTPCKTKTIPLRGLTSEDSDISDFTKKRDLLMESDKKMAKKEEKDNRMYKGRSLAGKMNEAFESDDNSRNAELGVQMKSIEDECNANLINKKSCHESDEIGTSLKISNMEDLLHDRSINIEWNDEDFKSLSESLEKDLKIRQTTVKLNEKSNVNEIKCNLPKKLCASEDRQSPPAPSTPSAVIDCKANTCFDLKKQVKFAMVDQVYQLSPACESDSSRTDMTSPDILQKVEPDSQHNGTFTVGKYSTGVIKTEEKEDFKGDEPKIADDSISDSDHTEDYQSISSDISESEETTFIVEETDCTPAQVEVENMTLNRNHVEVDSIVSETIYVRECGGVHSQVSEQIASVSLESLNWGTTNEQVDGSILEEFLNEVMDELASTISEDYRSVNSTIASLDDVEEEVSSDVGTSEDVLHESIFQNIRLSSINEIGELGLSSQDIEEPATQSCTIDENEIMTARSPVEAESVASENVCRIVRRSLTNEVPEIELNSQIKSVEIVDFAEKNSEVADNASVENTEDVQGNLPYNESKQVDLKLNKARPSFQGKPVEITNTLQENCTRADDGFSVSDMEVVRKDVLSEIQSINVELESNECSFKNIANSLAEAEDLSEIMSKEPSDGPNEKNIEGLLDYHTDLEVETSSEKISEESNDGPRATFAGADVDTVEFKSNETFSKSVSSSVASQQEKSLDVIVSVESTCEGLSYGSQAESVVENETQSKSEIGHNSTLKVELISDKKLTKVVDTLERLNVEPDDEKVPSNRIETISKNFQSSVADQISEIEPKYCYKEISESHDSSTTTMEGCKAPPFTHLVTDMELETSEILCKNVQYFLVKQSKIESESSENLASVADSSERASNAVYDEDIEKAQSNHTAVAEPKLNATFSRDVRVSLACHIQENTVGKNISKDVITAVVHETTPVINVEVGSEETAFENVVRLVNEVESDSPRKADEAQETSNNDSSAVFKEDIENETPLECAVIDVQTANQAVSLESNSLVKSVLSVDFSGKSDNNIDTCIEGAPQTQSDHTALCDDQTEVQTAEPELKRTFSNTTEKLVEVTNAREVSDSNAENVKAVETSEPNLLEECVQVENFLNILHERNRRTSGSDLSTGSIEEDDDEEPCYCSMVQYAYNAQSYTGAEISLQETFVEGSCEAEVPLDHTNIEAVEIAQNSSSDQIDEVKSDPQEENIEAVNSLEEEVAGPGLFNTKDVKRETSKGNEIAKTESNSSKKTIETTDPVDKECREACNAPSVTTLEIDKMDEVHELNGTNVEYVRSSLVNQKSGAHPLVTEDVKVESANNHTTKVAEAKSDSVVAFEEMEYSCRIFDYSCAEKTLSDKHEFGLPDKSVDPENLVAVKSSNDGSRVETSEGFEAAASDDKRMDVDVSEIQADSLEKSIKIVDSSVSSNESQNVKNAQNVEGAIRNDSSELKLNQAGSKNLWLSLDNVVHEAMSNTPGKSVEILATPKPICQAVSKLSLPANLLDVSMTTLDNMLVGVQRGADLSNKMSAESSEQSSKLIEDLRSQLENEKRTNVQLLEDVEKLTVENKTLNEEKEKLNEEKKELTDENDKLKSICSTLYHNEGELKNALKVDEDTIRTLNNRYEMFKDYANKFICELNEERDRLENELKAIKKDEK